MTDPVRFRLLAEQALDLERKYALTVADHDRKVAEALAPIVAAVGGDVSTARAVLQDAADASDDAAAEAVFRDALPKPRRAVAASKVGGRRPDRLLHAAGKSGAVLSVGGVLVLAGEGGVAKSPLALSIAASFAARTDYGDLHGGLFGGAGGPVLVASYEDWPIVSADRLRKLAGAWWPPPDATGATVLDRVHLLDLSGAPLFGPISPASNSAVLYNARPGPLGGWHELWSEVRRLDARLVVIDPAMAAYVGNANEAAPVREFLDALIAAAKPDRDSDWDGCGVLMVAHSRKEARDKPDPFDPGNVAGSTHWTDAARGVLTLTFDGDANATPGARILAIPKANYGPQKLLLKVEPVRARHGEIVGFTNSPGATWVHPPRKPRRKTAKREANDAGQVPAEDVASV